MTPRRSEVRLNETRIRLERAGAVNDRRVALQADRVLME